MGLTLLRSASKPTAHATLFHKSFIANVASYGNPYFNHNSYDSVLQGILLLPYFNLNACDLSRALTKQGREHSKIPDARLVAEGSPHPQAV